ncbi:unnamed protein product [Urochloa humidicola]
MGRGKRRTMQLFAAAFLLLLCVSAQLQGACAVAEGEAVGAEAGGGRGEGSRGGGFKGSNWYSSDGAAGSVAGGVFALVAAAGLAVWLVIWEKKKKKAAGEVMMGPETEAAVRTPVEPSGDETRLNIVVR